MSDEILDINNDTGEILVSASEDDLKAIKTTKIKAFNLLSKSDFCLINGVWEAKRDGLIKILSSLPISYSWIIQEKVLGVLSVTTGSITRSSDIRYQRHMMGIIKAKAKGIRFGRPRKLSQNKLLKAISLKELGFTSLEVANRFHVSKSTLLRNIVEYREAG